MGKCVASIKSGEPCGNTTKPGFKFCDDHKTRPKAIQEREQKALDNVVDISPAFVDDNKPLSETANKKPAAAQQRNIYEKTMDVLDQALDWEQKTREMMMSLSPADMRYTDKAGAEQLHSFVSLNERAMDRSIRAVTAIAKLDIDAQSININKMMRELIQSVVAKALTRAGLEPEQINQVRLYIAEEFQKAANEGNT